MKFSCEKILLQSAIATVSRAVSPKSNIPALEGILLEVGEEISLTGYNMETGIRTNLAADIQEPGTLVLSARLFGEIIRKLPDDVVTLSSKGSMVNITCGVSKFNIMSIDAEDFPELPHVEDQYTFAIGQNQLGPMLRQTNFAISDNDSRPIHTGALFEIAQNELTVVAVDGYRLALRREEISSCDGIAFSFVVPGGALNEVEKICGDTEELVLITQGEKHILFRTLNTILVTRRLEGEFLAWKQAIPRSNMIQVEVDTKALLTTIDRVSLIISDKMKSPLRCYFQEGLLSISTKTAIGDAADQCPIYGDGGDLEIGFNNRYMMEALKAVPASRVKLELSTGVAPCVIVPTEGKEKFLYMVLPVRLKGGH